jgi:hypothetical protein
MQRENGKHKSNMDAHQDIPPPLATVEEKALRVTQDMRRRVRVGRPDMG